MSKINNKIKGLKYGYVTFKGIGGYNEKMLSEIFESGIYVRRIKYSDGILSGAVSPVDYYRFSEIARSHGVKIRAGKRRGIYFTLAKYRTRAGLCAGFLLFVMYIAMYQSGVRSIVIEDSVENGIKTGAPKTQVMKILEECNIKIGSSTGELELAKAECRLLEDIKGCIWSDVSRVGYRVYVKLVTSGEAPEVEDDAPRNIVASRSAKIVRQIPRKGMSTVTNGSGVNTGDMLVSGTVSDGRDHILFVRADAEIIGEWTETREFFVPYNEAVSIADGEKKVFKYLICGDDVYPLFWGEAGAENSLYSEETSVVKLFGRDSVFKVKKAIYTAYTQRQIERSPDDVLSELQKQKADYEENLYGDYEIINAEERFYPQEDGIRLSVEYTLQGDIAKPVAIEMGDMTPPPESPAESGD